MTTVDKIMRQDVVALRIEESFEGAWRQLRDQGLGALPVVDSAGRLAGLLTEQDLLTRLAPRRLLRWWEAAFGPKDRLAAGYVKAVGTTVGDVMTVPPVMLEPEATVAAAASLLQSRGTDTLAVVADGICLGLVTRRDVLDHLSSQPPASPGALGDAELVRAMLHGIEQEPWADPHHVQVEADHGRLRLTGVVRSAMERTALVAMGRAIPGCRGVEDRLLVVEPGRRLVG